tara:strand:+ start:23 stop:316 length:294 start_codon:yes stop_codon:yes gene_type:complete
MKDKFKINVVIGGRSYPLHVSSTLEEEGTRKAADKINQLIVNFEKNYAVSDKQDVLAMSALQFASKLEIQTLLEKQNEDKASDKLQQMNAAIDVCLE